MINKTGKKIREWQKKIELEQGSIGTQETKKAEQNQTKKNIQKSAEQKRSKYNRKEQQRENAENWRKEA